ncbi:retinol dehydrogenase 11-like [Manduca sexta]|uniref:retinol dehydrogenase 11-like n=1 Tax=Manduca sexta TaxID=7130 RepID=UPI00188E0BC1|nr:retinol dehydrogenase 11-like [Manduca sexta]
MLLIIIIIIIVILAGFKFYYSLSSGMCTCDARMDGKVVIVTGANTGIGYETARELAQRGARVILACRSAQKGIAAVDSIRTATGNTDVVFKQLDLCSLRSVRIFAEDILNTESKLDVLINNAGTGILDNSLTEDNIPIEAQVNHFAPFLLTVSLLPLIKKSAPSRIINVSSLMHKFGKIDLNKFHKQAKNSFEHRRVYSNTKLANILFTNKLSKDLKGTGVTANSVHPGVVSTDIFRDKYAITKYLIRLLFKTPLQGAQTSIYLAVSPELKETTGKYFVDCCKARTSASGQDADLANKLWDLSCQVVNSEKKDL